MDAEDELRDRSIEEIRKRTPQEIRENIATLKTKIADANTEWAMLVQERISMHGRGDRNAKKFRAIGERERSSKEGKERLAQSLRWHEQALEEMFPNTVYLGDHLQVPPRRISKAPKPPTALRGGGWGYPEPKPMQRPPDFPPYYPDDLRPRTSLVISLAIKRFPIQVQVLDLCKFVVSELTADFRAAINAQTLRSDLAESPLLDLIRDLLIYNCDGGDKRFLLEQEVMRSEEWLKFVEAIAVEASLQPRKNGLEPMGRTPKRQASKQKDRLDGIFFGALQAGLQGPKYCAHLDRYKVQISADWQSEGCPATYVAAYRMGKPWKRKIHDQKHRYKLKYGRTSSAIREQLIQALTRPTRS